MKLFEMKKWQLTVSEEAWGLLPFKKILDRDKTKLKEVALKEMLFIFYFCDIKSNYLHMTKDERIKEIKHDIGLGEKWELDPLIQEAVELYNKLSKSVIEQLYLQSVKAAGDIGNYLENTKELLDERDSNNKPVTDIAKITMAVQRVPKLMKDLKMAYQEVVKEQEDNANRTKGSKQFNTFEQGFGKE